MLGAYKNISKIATLWFLLWSSLLFAQNKITYIERTLLNTPELTSKNPSLLQALQDSVLFNVKTYYKFYKGNFVNYFEPTQNYMLGGETTSYNRINSKTVMYGLASYHFSKGKNSSGSTFLYPYRTPFNFTPKDETTKGDRRIEKYQIAGGISYAFLPKWVLGVKVNYQTVNFAKLKDMRNINEILDFSASTGVNYQLTKNHKIGISYHYNRYIENVKISEYGNLDKDYVALINYGAFVGFFRLYGRNNDGILNSYYQRPWVDITHYIGVQYSHKLSEKIKWFAELQYANGSGLYGNDSDNSVVYMKHQKTKYLATFNTSIKSKKAHQIITVKGNYTTTSNNEQLFREVTTTAGNTITQYYGERETGNNQNTEISVRYNVFLGEHYQKALLQLFANYTHKAINREASIFPSFRKQDIVWHTAYLGASRIVKYKKTNFLIQFTQEYSQGSGGNPIDGFYIRNVGNVNPPDMLNTLLHKEREYFTSQRIFSKITTRISRNYNNNNVYLQLVTGYAKPFNTTYINGDVFNIALSLGIAF